jgi:hypothetical protein
MVIRHAPFARGRTEGAKPLRDLRRLRNMADYGRSGVEASALRILARPAPEFVREAAR